jgi:putative component of membrane protein insertase Oxa1/YidC/SpoIIIJ protein YidD
MSTLVRDLALNAISLYQRYLSPYKGYRCAYAFHTGCASCSRLGFRAIRWRGLLDGLALLVRRLGRCRDIFERRRKRPSATKAAPRASVIARDQRGFCDALACIPCDAGCALPCDATQLDAASNCINVAACSPSPCDCCDLIDLRSQAQRREDQVLLASREAERRRRCRDEHWPN